jgi:small-conductance mechanosensitive channel
VSARYGVLPAGRYLKARFGFEFADTEHAGLMAVQDALFSHAGEIQRLRDGVAQSAKHLAEELAYVRQSIQRGEDIYTPLGDSAPSDPISAAKRIEREERNLKTWVEAVKTLQDSLGVA